MGKESVKCEKLSQPHRTGPQQEQRDCLLGSLSPDQCPEGQKMLVRLSNVPMWDTSACRVQTKYILGTCEALGPGP